MDRPNILLISADALRADHLGCYGYHRGTSPFLDSLASEGVLCERLLSPAIPTIPSYTTLYTGQHPITHNIVSHPSGNQLDREAPCLPQEFLQAGYTTCAVDSLMRLRVWMGRGYEHYIDPALGHTLSYLGLTCDDVNQRAIPWLRSHADESFFMLLHYWDPHWPFDPPQRYRDLYYEGNNPFDPDNHSLDAWWRHPTGMIARDTWLRTQDGLITDPDYIAALHDQEIRYLDDGVAQLIGTLDELGIADRTLVVFTADHGVNLVEHGIFFDHIYGLYDGNIHVPLMFRWPGHLPGGVRLPQVLQISDIAPTLLEAAGLSVPSEMEGRSYWSPVSGQGEQRGHERVISVECTYEAKWSLRTEQYKFILPRQAALNGEAARELYDLLADPREENNIAESRPDIAGEMEAELEGWLAERLRSLGRDVDPIVAHGLSIGDAAGLFQI